jgi:hypothetical protein
MNSVLYLNKTYSKTRTGKRLSDTFPIQNGLKPGDAFFNFTSECVIRKVK